MKKFFKAIAYLVVALIVSVTVVIVYISNFLPKGEIKDITIEITPERVERGEYLANHVMLCMDCHSTRDWSKYSGPMVENTRGQGGERFDRTMGFPGEYYSSNITPFNLESWSDGEIYRAITQGIGKGDRALFPVMPFPNFSKASDEDIYAVIAYLRQLPAIENTTTAPSSDFPMNIIINTISTENDPQPIPSKDDKVAYGKYLTTAASCFDCHTQFDKGAYNMEMAYAGGREFIMPFGILRTANLTPDKETGLGNWSEDDFVAKFKSYDLSTYTPQDSPITEYNTFMPWTMYAGMETEDLEAIYAYLRSLEPIANEVEKVTFK